MSLVSGMKCKKHPQYKAVHEPRPTKRYPNGCDDCWKIYNRLNIKSSDGSKFMFSNLLEIGSKIHRVDVADDRCVVSFDSSSR